MKTSPVEVQGFRRLGRGTGWRLSTRAARRCSYLLGRRPMATTTVSLAAIRRLTVSTQEYAPRFRRARPGEGEGAIRRLGAVQLDSISAVDRAHRLTLSSRIGAFSEPELQ